MAKLSVEKAILKAKSYAKRGEFEEATKLYEAVLKSFPNNKRAQKGLTNLKYSKELPEVQNPPKELIDQLVSLYNQGQLEKVAEQATFLTQKYPRAFFIWNLLGVANNGLNKVSDAASAFKRVTELNPLYADGFNNFGATLKAQRKFKEAKAAFERAIELKPNYAEAYNNIGLIYKEQSVPEQALAMFEKALMIKPQYADAYTNIGIVLAGQGKMEEAIDAYNKAIKLNPNSAETYYNLANALKQFSPKHSMDNALIKIDSKIKMKFRQFSYYQPDRHLAAAIKETLMDIDKNDLNLQTPLSQIYSRSSVDLNCSRHERFFAQEQKIAEFCFGCFKVQIEVYNVLDLIKLCHVFYDIKFGEDLISKSMIELRPKISGSYKGLVYCRGMQQAKQIEEKIKSFIAPSIEKAHLKIKRGCSEFAMEIPPYGEIPKSESEMMQYPSVWRIVEDKFDHAQPIKIKTPIIPALNEFCFSDFLIMRKWIDYARGQDDPSVDFFQDLPIKYPNIFNLSKSRKGN